MMDCTVTVFVLNKESETHSIFFGQQMKLNNRVKTIHWEQDPIEERKVGPFLTSSMDVFKISPISNHLSQIL